MSSSKPAGFHSLTPDRLCPLADTNLAAIEQAVSVFKWEMDAAWQREALAADSRFVSGLNGSVVGPMQHRYQPERIRIPAEEVPEEYRNGLPPALQERLLGIRNVQIIVAEIYAFRAEQMSRQKRGAANERAVPLTAPPILIELVPATAAKP